MAKFPPPAFNHAQGNSPFKTPSEKTRYTLKEQSKNSDGLIASIAIFALIRWLALMAKTPNGSNFFCSQSQHTVKHASLDLAATHLQEVGCSHLKKGRPEYFSPRGPLSGTIDVPKKSSIQNGHASWSSGPDVGIIVASRGTFMNILLIKFMFLNPPGASISSCGGLSRMLTEEQIVLGRAVARAYESAFRGDKLRSGVFTCHRIPKGGHHARPPDARSCSHLNFVLLEFSGRRNLGESSDQTLAAVISTVGGVSRLLRPFCASGSWQQQRAKNIRCPNPKRPPTVWQLIETLDLLI
ncbi:hypothetical protein DFH09DRAFT_1285153 [Mycena vulgaris]|nr:hypothetical protein DFH09DRAFT_1285153 [Mycena vulgaris]